MKCRVINDYNIQKNVIQKIFFLSFLDEDDDQLELMISLLYCYLVTYCKKKSGIKCLIKTLFLMICLTDKIQMSIKIKRKNVTF